MIGSWLNAEVLKQTAKLKSAFVGAKPFSHVVIKNFLQDDKAEALLRSLKNTDFEHKESDLFSLNQSADFVDASDELLNSFFLLASSKEFASLMKEITGLSVKPGALDLAGSLYESGDYLLCHDDQVEDRKIAYILYLSKDFEDRDGARFVLFDDNKGKPGKEVQKYRPEWNSLMVFEVSKKSFHAVEENLSEKDRYAIGGWLH